MDPETVWARYGHYLLAGPPRGAAVVATVDRRPVGLLNLIVVGPRTVELSLLVADGWQRRGVATRLLAAELDRPRWAGWTVQAIVQPDNLPVRFPAAQPPVRHLAAGRPGPVLLGLRPQPAARARSRPSPSPTR